MSILVLIFLVATTFTVFSDDKASISQSGEYTTEEFTPQALQQLRNDVRLLISENEQGLTFDNPLTTVYDFNSLAGPPQDESNNWVLIPTILRLIFHDCVGTSNPGLCNGCVDLDHVRNAGLFVGVIDPLSDICDFNNDQYGLSYADCWALSATFALELSSELTEEVWNDPNSARSNAQDKPTQLFFQGDIPYYIGRIDCETTPDREEGSSDVLAEPDWTWELAAPFLKERFDLTNKEAVALISGGHSVGRGHVKVSGYAGVWNQSPSVVDNDIHWLIIGPSDRLGIPLNWQQGLLFDETVDSELAPLLNPQFHLFFPPPVFALNPDLPNPRAFLLLNVDVSLYWDLTYYTSRGLENEIDCLPQAVSNCAFLFPGSVVGSPGETQADYPNDVLCPFLQCPINCEGGEATLNAHIANDFADLDDNANCPAGFLREGFVHEHEFGGAFLSAFKKMITAGYDVVEDAGSSDSSDSSGGRPALTVMEYPFESQD